MKFIIIFLIIVVFFGCKHDAENVGRGESLSDTTTLQPQIEDKNSQPPSLPSI